MDRVMLDRFGRPVSVKKIPPRGKAKKLFSKAREEDNNRSPFERFASSNGSRSKFYSF